jgi:uncharacterized protein YraI
VTVELSGCGPDQSQVTGADAAFQFTDLPEGSCLVEAFKPGWIFNGSFPDLGYPVPVASDPELPTSFSIFMAPVSDALPTETPDVDAEGETPTVAVSPTSSEPTVTPIDLDVNCRFGPETTFLSIGALLVGESAPITGKLSSGAWWRIQNPDGPGTQCWVSAGFVQASGDLTSVPVVPPPVGLVIGVDVEAEVSYTACQGPNPVDFIAYIETNGPTTVTFHWEITGDKENTTADETLIFTQAESKLVPVGAYSADCGSYMVTLLVTSPNSISAFDNFTIP